MLSSGGLLGYEWDSAVWVQLPGVTDLFALVVAYGDIRGLVLLGSNLHGLWFPYYDAFVGEVDLA